MGANGLRSGPPRRLVPVWEPAACLTCRSVFSIGRTDASPRCPVCLGAVHFYCEEGFYSVPNELVPTFNPWRDKWEKEMRPDKFLYKLNFFCPRCEGQLLRFGFSDLGCYD
jgi:hypothetical protein